MSSRTAASAEKIEENIKVQALDEAIHEYMMPYAEYVILDRQIARVEDGLKPVQRRILYAMHELGMKPDGPYRKSARVVGDCLGKYHPHGDSSIYNAMVNMAQSFGMRNVLVDGQGNFGSIDGDPPAAMRYTEVRLAPLAMEMLRDLEKDTVRWNKNFDDSLFEPDVLPSRIPNLLVNGSVGIAIGLATCIPTHNLTEVIDGAIAVIDNPKIALEELLTIIKGPDFPTGGFVAPIDSFYDIYRTGKGRFAMRAKVDIENEGGRQSVIVHELPYNVNKSALEIKINELRTELSAKKPVAGKSGAKAKGRGALDGIQDIVDESDRNGIRIAIKLKKGEDAAKVLECLYEKTALQTNFNVNMVAIADGRPRQLGLIPILKYYIAHQRDVVLRRTQHDCAIAKKREHVLDGFAIVLPRIDEVVRIIKASGSRSEARAGLRKAFGLSEKQADAVLDMKLASLTRLEISKIESELAQLKKQIARFAKIIESKSEQLAVVKAELLEIRQKYGVRRLTTIVSDLDEIRHKPFEPGAGSAKRGYLTLGADGGLRFSGNVEFLNSSVRERPATRADIIRDCARVDGSRRVYAFTDRGNCLRVDVDAVAERRDPSGLGAASLSPDASPGERFVRLFAFDESQLDSELYFFTRGGLAKKGIVRDYVVNKPFYQAMILRPGDAVLNVEIRAPGTCVALMSSDGYCLNLDHSEFPATGRKSGGVIGILLNPGAEVAFAGQLEKDPFDDVPAGELVFVSSDGYAKRVHAFDLKRMKRARKGLNFADASKAPLIYVGAVAMAYDIAFARPDGAVETVSTEDILITRVARSRGKQCPAARGATLAVRQRGEI